MDEPNNKILDFIRILAPEFNAVDDKEILGLIDFYSDFVSKKYFGKYYEKALAFYIAHQLTLSNTVANSEDGGQDTSIIAGDITSEKEGDLQRSYGSSGTSTSAVDELLNKTYYGKMYLNLLYSLRPLGITRIKKWV